MSDLFGQATPLAQPLAELLRPKSLDEVVGQKHLIGPGRPLRLAFESRRLMSFLLYGTPGCGKTTIARLTATHFDAEWIALSAVFSGVKEIREAIAEAERNQRMGRCSILFIDEVHRFSKSQQDAFLPHVESGLITFIGATTENPSFEVNSALLSRARVFKLEPLSDDDLGELFDRAVVRVASDRRFDAGARRLTVAHADGDGRRLLNLVEQMVNAAETAGMTEITETFAADALSSSVRRFDKGGDDFYDQISALHKSVRGSSPDAALYWLSRMLDGGADPHYLARRIIRMAWEDIGLADPRAMQIANDAAQAYDRLGSPEGELALGQAVLYLAMAAKSNAGYNAYNAARAFVSSDKSRPVPLHLRNAPTRLMKELGYGKQYKYPHDSESGYIANEQYWPDGVPAPSWYRPVQRGMEIKIAEKLAWLRALDEAAAKGGKSGGDGD